MDDFLHIGLVEGKSFHNGKGESLNGLKTWWQRGGGHIASLKPRRSSDLRPSTFQRAHASLRSMQIASSAGPRVFLRPYFWRTLQDPCAFHGLRSFFIDCLVFFGLPRSSRLVGACGVLLSLTFTGKQPDMNHSALVKSMCKPLFSVREQERNLHEKHTRSPS